jgi:hypothetical protein
MNMNDRSASWARTAMLAYASVAGLLNENPETVLIDLLTDLRHMAVGLDFDEINDRSKRRFAEEVENPDLDLGTPPSDPYRFAAARELGIPADQVTDEQRDAVAHEVYANLHGLSDEQRARLKRSSFSLAYGAASVRTINTVKAKMRVAKLLENRTEETNEA